MTRRAFIAGMASAAAWPVVARGQQQSALPVIGVLNSSNETISPRYVAAFHQGLAQQGFVEGKNVDVLYRWGEFEIGRLPILAADLAQRHVTVIAAFSTAAAVAAKSASTTIPIVFVTGSDPVGVGLVSSLSHPGGNTTGVTFLAQQLTAKRLALLHDLVPTAGSIGYLVNPTGPASAAQVREAESAARRLGVRLAIENASIPQELEGAFARFAQQRLDAALLDASELFSVERERVAALALHHRVPTMCHVREMVEAGGLLSYGGALTDQDRLLGDYVGRVLKGEKPGDLPVQQSVKIELVVNLRTARAIGIAIPESFLIRADEVIE
jgi:putative tryptophan/tyrosine transport system substrate-binding protein